MSVCDLSQNGIKNVKYILHVTKVYEQVGNIPPVSAVCAPGQSARYSVVIALAAAPDSHVWSWYAVKKRDRTRGVA